MLLETRQAILPSDCKIVCYVISFFRRLNDLVMLDLMESLNQILSNVPRKPHNTSTNCAFEEERVHMQTSDKQMRTKTSEGLHAQRSDEVDNKLKQTSLQPHTFID